MRTPSPTPDSLGRAFSIRDAATAGLAYGRLRGRDLGRPFHGVRTTSPADSLLGRCADYAPRMRADEFYCSVTAALIHGLPLPLAHERDPRLHVAVPNPRRAPRSRGIVGHKFIVQPARGEVIEVAGFRVSSPERAWCELGAILDFRELVRAGDQLIRPANRLSSASQLRATLERHPARRGRETLHAAFAQLNPGAESPPETDLRLLCIEAELTGFVANLTVTIPGAGRRRRIDIAFVREKVALEYQGDHHRDPRQWREDMTRLAELESIGWKVTHVNADDLRDPRALVARIRRVLAAHS